MSAIHQVLLAGGAAAYQVPYSLRFRASASARLTRTYGATGSSQKFTGSVWIKRGILGSIQSIFGAQNTGAATWDFFAFNASDQLQLFIDPGTTPYNVITTAVFRDPSAWYHVVFSVDTTQATAANRVRIYVNNVEQSLGTNTIPQNYNLRFNVSGNTAGIGTEVNYAATTGPAKVIDGYFAEINWVDGQQLTPSSFGQTDSATGVWVPKKYSGTYGTNGFYLKFNDATTTTTIGNDSSGNGNNWTTSGISVTSGVTFDQMLDTPTLNYAVWNPLDSYSSTYSSYANMRYGVGTGVGYVQSRSTFQLPSSGKWYWEITFTSNGASPTAYLGIASTSESLALNTVTGGEVRSVYTVDGKSYDGTTSTTYGAAISTSSVVGIAADMDNGTIKFSVGGNYANGSGSFNQTYSAGASAFTDLVSSGKKWSPWAYIVQAYADVNFGQRAFNTDAPTGFKALNTANLPTPSIKKGSLYMNATLRTGTGATASVSSLGFQPDLVWIKSRSAATNHNLFDSTRGVQKGLGSNLQSAQYTDANSLTAFNSNGYSLGSDASSRGVNINTNTYVDWAWKESVSSGFDVVTFAGNGSAQTINHSLGVTPEFMILRVYDDTLTRTWTCWHKNLTSAAYYLPLEGTSGEILENTAFNSTAPTSTQFTAGSYNSISTKNTIAYLWAGVEGFSKFGSYTGNGSTDGPFVWCGFRPRYVLIKSRGAENWSVQDSVRNPSNVVNARLKPNSADAEAVSSVQNVDFLSNGFKIRTTDPEKNGSGTTYIFAAFAENPFKYARAR